MSQKAVTYVRVSSKKQDAFSPKVQLEKCLAYAENNRLKVVGNFRDTASGWKANQRPDFSKMIGVLRKEGITNAIFAYGDRVGRNFEDYIDLKATGVTFHDAVSGISFCPTNPEHYDQTAAFEHDQVEAKKFSAKNSHKVRSAYEKRVKEGICPHSLPIGLKRVTYESNGKMARRIEVDDTHNRAALVKQMFQLFATGDFTRTQISEKMRELGLRSKKGKPFSLSQIEDMLKDPKYTGCHFVWKGIRHDWKENCPPLIPMDIFIRVQRVFEEKRRGVIKRGLDFKHKGLLTCDFCGCDVVGDMHEKVLKRSGEKRTYVYYRCTGGKDSTWYREHFRQPKCPMYSGPYHSEADIDEFIETAIENLYVDPDTMDWVKCELEEDYRNLKQLRQDELAQLKKRQSEIENDQGPIAQRAALAKPPLQSIYEQELTRLVEERTSIEARIRSIETGEDAVSLENIHDTLELSKSLKDNYLAASPEKRAKLNKLMFRTIRVTKEGWIPTHEEGDECLTIAPFYFVWNEPFRSLWEIGFIQQMSEAEAGLTAEQKAHKPKLSIRERA
jgi:hypothetical protein